MHASDAENKKEYKIEDLSQFFKGRSKDISKKFSDKLIKISTIRSKIIENEMQEFSFELRLLSKTSSNEQALHSAIFHKIKGLISFFKPSLQEGKTFKYAFKIGNKKLIISNGLWDTVCSKLQDEKNKPIWDILDEAGKHTLNRKKYDAREFSELSPEEQLKILNVFSEGITIKLLANVEDINLNGLHEIKLFLSEVAEISQQQKETENKEKSQVVLRAAQTENVGKKEQNETEPTKQKETAQNTQVVPFTGSFGYGVTKSENQKQEPQ